MTAIRSYAVTTSYALHNSLTRTCPRLLVAVGGLALLLVGARLDAICSGGGEPRVLEAAVEACRRPEKEIRAALEPYRASHEAWVASLPEPLRANRQFEQRIEASVARREVVVTVRVLRIEQLGADPRRTKDVAAGAWQAVEAPKSSEYLLRLGSEVGSDDCDSLLLDTPRLFLEEMTCCDVEPPSDNACLLDLPALVLAPDSLGQSGRPSS
jgi:hypothetical protein